MSDQRFHLSKDNVPRPCDARPGHCPLKDANGNPQEHFNSFAEAENHAFARNSSMSMKMLQAKSLKTSYSVLRRTPLKNLDAGELVLTLVNEAQRAGIAKESIESSVTMATILHSHQKRANRGEHHTTPYIEHPLRNALRALRLGVKDETVIVSIVLHDTVEDGSLKFSKKFTNSPTKDEQAARNQLRGHIEKTYGARCRHIVDGVTNPIEKRGQVTNAEKRQRYFEKTSKSIQDPDIGILLNKFVDFGDNAGGLHHNDVPGRELKTYRQAKKYKMMVPAFIEEFKKRDLSTVVDEPEKVRSYAIEKLKAVDQRLDKIIANEGRTR